MNLPTAAIGRWIDRTRDAALDLFFPPQCGGCGVEMLAKPGGGAALCSACVDELPLIDWPVCPRCAGMVPTAGDVALDCSHCRGAKLRFERTIALGSYEGLLRRLIMQLKTDRSERLVHLFAELAWQKARAELVATNADVVAAVPMHRWRRWRRGTNPPLALAEKLAKKLALPAAGDMLRLKRNVSPQLGLSRAGRLLNLQGEMGIRRGYLLEAAHILLVDDILTTGATCNEAARVLRRAGATNVTVFVLARTPADG